MIINTKRRIAILSDALSQILDVLKLKGSIYFHTDFHRPWGIKVPASSKVIRFHMAMRGECWFRIDGVETPIFMSTNDLIVIPHGVSHEIVDNENGNAIAIDDLVNTTGSLENGTLRSGDGRDSRPCQLICGHFEFEEGASHPLLSALPEYMHFKNTQDVHSHWFETAMRFMSSEILSSQAGTDAIVHRLAEIIFIHAIRNYVGERGDDAGFIAAVLDANLARCLSKIHSEPAQKWTVASLASTAGMSRTIFAERFKSLIGMTPMEYVTRWRMQQARRQLIKSDMTLSDIVIESGYGSEAAFTRAFKRYFDLTPGQMRRSV